MGPGFCLDMGVIADMVFTVAMVTVAAGAVTEFQIRMGNIRAAANGAPMRIRCLGGCGGCLVRTGVEGNHFGLLLVRSGARFSLAEEPAAIGTPGQGNDIQNFLAEEQEVIGQGNQGEKVVGEGVGEQARQDNHQIQQSENPCFDRDDIEQQEMGVGIHGGVTQEQAHVQVVHIRGAAENHAVNVHQQNAGEVEQIEFEGAPAIFHSPAQRKIAEQADQLKQNVLPVSGQGIGNQTPHLTLENQVPVKIQKIVQERITAQNSHHIDNSGADGNIEHQIGNALVSVLKTKPFKFSAKVTQRISTPKSAFPYSISKVGKSL